MRILPDMRYLVAALFMSLAHAAPAQASGAFSCEAADKAVKFSTSAGLSRGGGMFLNMSAQLQIRDGAVPQDLRKLELAGEDITQRWLHGRELKLRFYRERDNKLPHGYVDLLIEARESKEDESKYRGSYRLSIYSLKTEQDSDGQRTTLRGKVDCFVE